MDDKQQEKREARRKRRIRNQIVSYMAVMLLIAAGAVGVVFGARQITESRQAQKEDQKNSQAVLDDFLASEPDLPSPPSESDLPAESTPEPVPELTPEQRLDEIVDSLIEVMPLEDKVAGLFIVTPESITGVGTAVKAGEGTKDALNRYAVGGIVYAAKNVKSEEQFKEMLENTSLYTKYPIFLAVEEEGGKRSTVANAGIGTKVDDPKTIGQSGDTDAAYQAGVTLGTNLSGVGINLNLGPVADPAVTDNSWLGERSFGAGGVLSGSMASSAVQGLQSQDVTACVKYFPGVGSTAENPEAGLAGTERTEEQFRSEEFPAFQAVIAAGADMIMVSSVAAPGLTGNNEPCVFSAKVVTDILREEMGFEGVIISDSLDMAAISDYNSSEEAAIMALKAGCDMLYMPEDFEKAYNGVLQAVQDGTISEERIDDALRRIYRIKYADKIEE
ncbi:MAG: beta-N-acetylhexosaminidase [Butyrivibrio sp.]|nr:beta-N-acetylhexosaminidase [Acetatifactor muris]MCM1558816.1 beta-N-acetylhexosaminidase [Butyrivibrio sp.]